MRPILANKAGSFVTDNVKPIIISIGVLTGSYLLYKWISKPRVSVQFDASYPSASISDNKAKQIANVLFNAMSNPGTDEDAIFNALAGLGFNDFVKVSNFFGVKYYDTVLGVEGGSLFNDQYDLRDWLYFELGNSDLEKLHNVAPNLITFDNQFKTLKRGANNLI